MVESPVFLQLLILLGAVTVVATLCNALKLPTIVGFIIAGLTVGPFGLRLVDSLPNAGLVAEMAIIFLMFTIGLEFSFKKLVALKREFFRLGLLQVAVTILLTALVGRAALDLPLPKALFVGYLISLSSTALVMKLLQDAREVETPYGKNGLSILLFQDLAVIPMMLSLPLLLRPSLKAGALPQMSGAAVAVTAAAVVAMLVGLWLASRYVIPFLLEQVVATRSREVFFYSVIFLCLGVAYLFSYAGLSLSLGAFAAGLMISEGPYGRQVTADIVPLRDSFLGLFFASVGMLLDLRFVAAHWWQLLAFIAALFVIKTLMVTAVALVNRLPLSIAVIMGLMLMQIGEFSFILAARGRDLGLLGDVDYQYFLSASVLSMAFTPFLFKLAPRLALLRPASRWRSIATSRAAGAVREQVRTHAPHGAHKTADPGHTIIVGFGISGQNLAAAFDSLHIPYKAIELNYAAVKRRSREGVNIHYGDATRSEVLEHAGIQTARLVVIAVAGAKLIEAVIHAVRRLRPDVQIIVRSQYVRDIEAIPQEPRTDIVIGEIETTVELLAHSLRVYGVSSGEIRQYMDQARTQLSTYAQLAGSLASPQLTLPSWEALSMVRPLRVASTYKAHGKTLAELSLRQRTGAAIVSVFREGLGTTIPGGSFELRVGDVVHVIGDAEALAAVERVLGEG